jgi:hypothetical protein
LGSSPPNDLRAKFQVPTSTRSTAGRVFETTHTAALKIMSWLRTHITAEYRRISSALVQVFGRRNDETDHALKRPATKKRQGTKSRAVGQCLAAGAMGI